MEIQFGSILKKARDRNLAILYEDGPNLFCQLTISKIFRQLLFTMIYVFL